MTQRKSQSLNKQTRSDMLHAFFADVSRRPTEILLSLENALALEIYDLIYSDSDVVGNLCLLPEAMFNMSDNIPIEGFSMKAKKKSRRRGTIEPTKSTRYKWRNFAHYMSVDVTEVLQDQDHLSLSEEMPQVNQEYAARWSSTHLNTLVKKKFISKATFAKIEVAYVRGCKAGNKITAPIVEVLDDVSEILCAVKTTKGLFAAWPDAEKYLNLPEPEAGALMKVDIRVLGDRLADLYPPSEKSSATV